MYNDIIKLVSVREFGSDGLGNINREESERSVYAELRSIGTTEFYQAQALGLKPEVKFVIADYLDYQGEEVLKYSGYESKEEVYRVIRTFRNGNELEITCKRGIEP